jgi:hypothetical protein
MRKNKSIEAVKNYLFKIRIKILYKNRTVIKEGVIVLHFNLNKVKIVMN